MRPDKNMTPNTKRKRLKRVINKQYNMNIEKVLKAILSIIAVIVFVWLLYIYFMVD